MCEIGVHMFAMRVDLGELHLTNTTIDLSTAERGDQRITVRSAEKLTGQLATGPSGSEISGAHADKLVLDLLRLRFGTVALSATPSASFQNLRAQLAIGTATQGQTDAERVNARELTVTVGSLRIAGELEAEGMTLVLEEHGGYVQAEHATFHGFRVDREGLQVRCAVLETERLRIGWGKLTTIRCARATFPSISVTQQGLQTNAVGGQLIGVDVAGGRVALERALLEALEGTLSFNEKPDSSGMLDHEWQAAPVQREERRSLWDKSMLDSLSGKLDVDVEVELEVPLLGTRRATHKLRVPISDGSIDFIDLEHGLAPLEDALINFAVREKMLSLEVGIPLVGRRGHGRPLLLWDLDGRDQALAQENRVRLAVVPNVRLAGSHAEKHEESTGESPSKHRFALRRLGLVNLATDLSLAPHRDPWRAVLSNLVVGKLHVEGEVHHDAREPPRPGQVRAVAQGLACSTEGMPLGSSTLSAHARLERVEEAEAHFEGTRLVQVRAVTQKLAFSDVLLEPTR